MNRQHLAISAGVSKVKLPINLGHICMFSCLCACLYVFLCYVYGLRASNRQCVQDSLSN